LKKSLINPERVKIYLMNPESTKSARAPPKLKLGNEIREDLEW
jgi:hypothetical protein